MSPRKLKVVLTRRLPDAVETRMRELFDAELNLKDQPMDRAALQAAVQRAEVALVRAVRAADEEDDDAILALPLLHVAALRPDARALGLLEGLLGLRDFRVAASSPLFERVAPTGRTFVVPVDLGAITASCGEECTEDGIHYAPASYDAAAQIIANALRAAWTE